MNIYAKFFSTELAELAAADRMTAEKLLNKAKSAAKMAIHTHDFGKNDPEAKGTTFTTFQEKYTELVADDPSEAYGYALFTRRTYGK